MASAGEEPLSGDAAGDVELEHDAVLALTTVLVRAYEERGRTGDGDVARRLLRSLDQPHVDKMVRGAAAGAVMSMLPRPQPPERKLVLAARICARVLCEAGSPPHKVLLGGVTLALMALAGHSGSVGTDLLFVAERFRSIEQYGLAARSVRGSLSSAELVGDRLVHAWLLLAQVSGDADAGLAARSAAEGLHPDNVVRRAVEATIWPERGQAEQVDAALDSRVRGARRMLEVLDGIRDQGHGDDLLSGLRAAMKAYSRDEFDLAGAREGLAQALQFWRTRRNLGQVPRAATAGLDAAIDLLLVHHSSDEIILLCEVIEAMGDAGLTRGNVGWGKATAGPLELQAALARRVLDRPTWPDLAGLLSGYADRDILLLYPRLSHGGTSTEVICVYLRPPAGVLLRRARLDAPDQSTLDGLAAGMPTGLRSIDQAAVDRMVTNIVPETVARSVGAVDARELTVVPLGQLACVPWGSCTAHGYSWRLKPVATTASMSLGSVLTRPPAAVHAVHALVDERIPAGRALVAGLSESVIRHQGLDGLPTQFDAGDILLVFAHGFGEGLEYRLELPSGPVGVPALAHSALPARVVLASCRSGAPPPAAFPLAVPTALMLAGADLVVAGLWPLPSEPTARVLIDALRSAHHGLGPAIRSAQGRPDSGPLIDRGGLAVFGRDDGSRTPTS